MTVMTHLENLDHRLRGGEHLAEINGFDLHYTVRGSGPVLLLPAPGSGPSVGYLIPLTVLESHCTVVYFDTRHSGSSSGPDDPAQYTLDHFVADLDALRVHLGVDRVFVAGHSGGGHQALAYGIAHGEHVLGLIGIDAIVAPDALRMVELLRRIEAKRREPFYRSHPTYIDDALALMTGAEAPSLGQLLEATGALYFHSPERAAAVFATMEFDDQVLEYTQASGFQNKNLLPELAQVTAPTLLVYGEDDFHCDPITQGARAHALMPSSRLEIIPEAGHLPWLEQPAPFATACARWFATLPAESRPA